MTRLAATLLALTLAFPAAAQQLSPLTGTTAGPGPNASPPAASAPAAPPPTRTAPSDTETPQHRQRMTARQRFETANTTHDGKLTLDQAKAGHMRRVVTNFDAIDTGRKGYVTMADIQAYNRAQRQARRARQQHQ